jgi:hypothetical protein
MPLSIPVRRMPSAAQLGEFLTDLLGREITCQLVTDELAADATGLMCGTLVDESGQVGGACLAEVGTAAHAGAALAMIPRAVADDAAASGELNDNLRDNFAEVVNIMTGLVNTPIHDHLRMSGIEAGVPDTVGDLLLMAAGRATYRLDIADYGSGRLSLFAR